MKNRFYLLGKSLKHSFSANYFKTKFEALKLTDYKYSNLELDTLERLRDIDLGNLMGLNVTIPYKEKVLDYLDFIDPTAKNIGAVNTIKITDGKWIGYNTDYLGFKTSIEDLLEGNLEVKALVLGSGGASKAIKYALEMLDIGYQVVSRKGSFNYSDLSQKIIKDYQLIINTTPLGMYPHLDQYPLIPYSFLSAEHYLFDLIYNPEKTLFLEKGASQNAKTKNGMEMLVCQAEKSWEIWNSIERKENHV